MRENMKIRKAELKDLSRIAEIFVFNNRINYFPIFHEEAYSFGEMQVVPMIDQYFKKEEILNRIYVYDDGIIRGFTEINGTEICKLYVDPCLQNNGVGHGLITFAIESLTQTIYGHWRKIRVPLRFTTATDFGGQERNSWKQERQNICWN